MDINKVIELVRRLREEPERTAEYKAMQASLYPRGSTVDSKQRGENATAHRVGGWKDPKKRDKKAKRNRGYGALKSKLMGEASAVLDANKKLENQAWRKKKQKEYAKLIAIYNHQKQLEKQGLGSSTKRKKTTESFEIDKSAHKKAQRQSKIRNLAKDNKNPNEKAAAERKLKGPKLAWEEFKKHI